MVSLTVDPFTNRISTFGFSYDAAGNLIQWPGGTATIGAEYDVEGRMSRVLYNGVEQEKYFYNARNQRVKNRYSPLRVYGLGGELLGEYVPEPGFTRPTRWLERVYFAGACVGEVDSYGGWRLPSVDRLGSLKHGSRRYPFGDGNESYANDEYATYRKDTASAHYYAWHRYYSATWGRFSSPDPYVMSGGLTNPQGWNRYSYVANDPVNFNDPSGLVACGSSFSTTPGGWSMTVYDCVSWWSRLSHWTGGGGGRESLGNLAMQDDSDIRPYTDPCAGMVWCAMFPGDVSLGGQGLEGLQNFLGLMGLVPGAGEFADAANALIYAIRGDMVNAGLSVAAMLPIGGQAVFSAKMFRANVLKRLGMDAAEAAGKYAHHVFPKQFGKRFADLGLDVNDPRFGVLLTGPAHDLLHYVLRYNAQWDEWLKRNPNATADDALNFARKLAGDYGFSFNP